MTLYRT